jgi:excisionase family DNA binding protein
MKICNDNVTTKLLTVKQVYQTYGQGYWFWYNLVKAGRIAFIQTESGGKILLDVKDVEKWITKQKKTISY